MTCVLGQRREYFGVLLSSSPYFQYNYVGTCVLCLLLSFVLDRWINTSLPWLPFHSSLPLGFWCTDVSPPVSHQSSLRDTGGPLRTPNLILPTPLCTPTSGPVNNRDSRGQEGYVGLLVTRGWGTSLVSSRLSPCGPCRFQLRWITFRFMSAHYSDGRVASPEPVWLISGPRDLYQDVNT